jgi:hypothetical protein
MVAQGVESATATTSTCREWQWQTEPAKNEQTKMFGRISGFGPIGDGGEDTASIWPALGIEKRLAGWWQSALQLGPG